MTALRSDLVAAIRLIQGGGSGSSRVERLAAAGIGLLVLTGALVTYVVLPGPAADRPAATAPGPR